MAGGSAGSSGFCQKHQTAVAYVAHMVKTLKWNRLPNTFVSSPLFSNKRRRVADVKILELTCMPLPSRGKTPSLQVSNECVQNSACRDQPLQMYYSDK